MEHMNSYLLMMVLFIYAIMESCIETQSLLDVEPLSGAGQRL